MSSKSECISIPKGNEKLPHEKLLEYVENNNPTEREIFDNFPLDREVLESVMDYQLKVSKSIEKYSVSLLDFSFFFMILSVIGGSNV